MLCLDPDALPLAFQITIDHANEPEEVGGKIKNKRSPGNCFAHVGQPWLLSSAALTGETIRSPVDSSLYHADTANSFKRPQANVFWVFSQWVLFMTSILFLQGIAELLKYPGCWTEFKDCLDLLFILLTCWDTQASASIYLDVWTLICIETLT